ncbi:MAG: NTP transferase domain-containing protein [Actinomycetota bacterium]
MSAPPTTQPDDGDNRERDDHVDQHERGVAHIDGATAVGVLLAAGAGTRFDGATHKLLAVLPATASRPAETVAARSLAAAATAASRPPFVGLVVVTGAVDLGGHLLAAHGAGHAARAATPSLVHNEHWEDGQAGSVRLGVDAARRLGADVVVIGLADQPDVTVESWLAVADAATAPGARPIAVATYGGRPRNPVALHRQVWNELPATGDTGARDLIRLSPSRVTQVPSRGSPADIDTVEDLARWQNS